MAPILAIPQYHGARAPLFSVAGGDRQGDVEVLLTTLVRRRVWGCYWCRQVTAPPVLDATTWPAYAGPWALLNSAADIRPPDDPRALLARAAGKTLAVWRSSLSAAQTKVLMLEVEAGILRSAGPGADCLTPLLIIVDNARVYFDLAKPSGIQIFLQHSNLFPDLVTRAQAPRAAIIAGGLSKNARGESATLSRAGDQRRHLPVPGGAEDDRAVTSSGVLSSNLELLRRARAEVGPEAYVIYKPHPNAMAGHGKGLTADADMAALADQVESAAPMADVIMMAGKLQVNSSLAGFEALLRSKSVTIHTVPFYAGSGLCSDRGPVPARRTARCRLDELVATAYLLYPRYLDPETDLFSPVEVLVESLTSGAPSLNPTSSTVCAVRRATGRMRRLLGR